METKDIIISIVASIIASYIYDKIKNHSSRPTKSGIELDIKIKFKKSK
ncbi:MAG: hypothetical protein ACRCXT_11125 [Paraclostridium sp.]